MAIQSTKSFPKLDAFSSDTKEEKPLCARDCLLNAMKTAPRLSREDAEAMNAVIREAREGSLTDELHG